MNYNEALSYIHSLLVFGSIPGLERINELLNKLGNPQDKLKFIHVAGTNGKGSCCTMLANVYKESGYKTGLYTSPYIVNFRERMQINGEYIPKETLVRLTKQVKDTGVVVTEFEFITALAMLWFNEENCDLVVLEVGLGGRFDATNIIKSPLCSVIMKIDYDHTAVLGDTIEQITNEKCGIIKRGCPVVSYPLQEKEAVGIIHSHNKNTVIPDLSKLQIISSNILGNRFLYNGVEYKTRLIGEHQIYNAITVIETVKSAGIDVDLENIISGIAGATVPARLELISKQPLVFLDGAHNPNGADALCGFMKNYDGEICALVGMMRDKNCDGFLEKVLKYCKCVVTVAVKENPRTATAEELAQISENYCKDVMVALDYDEAIDAICNKSQGKAPVFVFGSLYLAGALREKLISKYNL
ncbi:MAG: bifunctional folylpolyglutamate synthase/dihydrofolate synthase [Clostridia bacterium]|nr:bifunctional folylpolyglutamate synthase/dihydrofolate synthase [Clostridia bacterium]